MLQDKPLCLEAAGGRRVGLELWPFKRVPQIPGNRPSTQTSALPGAVSLCRRQAEPSGPQTRPRRHQSRGDSPASFPGPTPWACGWRRFPRAFRAGPKEQAVATGAPCHRAVRAGRTTCQTRELGRCICPDTASRRGADRSWMPSCDRVGAGAKMLRCFVGAGWLLCLGKRWESWGGNDM